MILEIDVGNTFLKWRLCESAAVAAATGRLPTQGELDSWLDSLPPTLERVLVGSVANDAFNRKLSDALVSAGYPAPLFARTAHCQAGVTNSYDNPDRMGVDRWLAMLAAWQRGRSACCVVDCGSAITVDYLAADGRHRGGYILPGMRVLRQALLGNTARVFIDRPAANFDATPGRNTSDAVTHGADFMFDAVQRRVRDSLAEGDRLFVTGGDGELFHRLAGRGEWLPDLVLDGLSLALEC